MDNFNVNFNPLIQGTEIPELPQVNLSEFQPPVQIELPPMPQMDENTLISAEFDMAQEVPATIELENMQQNLDIQNLALQNGISDANTAINELDAIQLNQAQAIKSFEDVQAQYTDAMQSGDINLAYNIAQEAQNQQIELLNQQQAAMEQFNQAQILANQLMEQQQAALLLQQQMNMQMQIVQEQMQNMPDETQPLVQDNNLAPNILPQIMQPIQLSDMAPQIQTDLNQMNSGIIPPNLNDPMINQTGGLNAPVFGGNNQYDVLISQYSNQYGVDPVLVKSVILKESTFNPSAKSSCNAQGLMQLMPKTASSLGCNSPYDPEQNIEAGTKYLSQLIAKYNGNVQLALAAYNAGSGNVEKAGNQIPKSAQGYVNKVMEYYSSAKNA